MATSLAWARGLEDSRAFFGDLRDSRLENWTRKPSIYVLDTNFKVFEADYPSTFYVICPFNGFNLSLNSFDGVFDQLKVMQTVFWYN